MSTAPAAENSPQQLCALTAEKLTQMLDSYGIFYEIHHHAPIFTVAEGAHLKASIPGVHCRNLFLVDKKKRMMLLVLANETAVDLKTLPALLKSDRLSFGSAERLWQYLEITPGSVNPFCIANDKNHAVDLFLDQRMMEADIVNYHPMDNAQTISLKPSDLLKYLEKIARGYTLVNLATD